jgi:hypothetical protein
MYTLYVVNVCMGITVYYPNLPNIMIYNDVYWGLYENPLEESSSELARFSGECGWDMTCLVWDGQGMSATGETDWQ